MVVHNSIRQLLRTPTKTLFFFALLTASITFFMLGYNLWRVADQNIDQIEHSFTTIGTVEQKAISSGTASMLYAQTEHAMYSTGGKGPEYGKPIPISVLDFKGANYTLKPEQRPYYVAYDPGYVVGLHPEEAERDIDDYNLIVEMEPLADCVTGDHPVKMRIKKVLFGKLDKDVIWFDDHFATTPEKLSTGKIYIAYLQEWPPHDASYTEDEYIPATVTETTQRSKDGERIKDTMPVLLPWDEVTENFFQSPLGMRWQAVIDGIKRLKHEIPVVPTNGTKLLMPFFNSEARVIDGRDISAEEYRNGEKVCLIQRAFAANNKLSVGDSLRLPLYYAYHWGSSSFEFFQPSGADINIYGLVNAKGEGYSAFEDSTYRIVGIYSAPPVNTTSGYQMGNNAVVIPSASVKNSDENNIMNIGPMMGFTTSFQIPNGQIEQYEAAWNALGITGLDIKFYDQGYSRIKAGLEAMRSTAIILFAVGAVTTLFVMILFCHLYITKQRKRTAIERSLGMSKGLCAASMLAGIMLIVIAAYALGSAANYGLTELTVHQVNTASVQEAFDTSYSDWVNGADKETASALSISPRSAMGGAAAGVVLLPVALLIALINIRGNLRSEPLMMLSEKER